MTADWKNVETPVLLQQYERQNCAIFFWAYRMIWAGAYPFFMSIIASFQLAAVICLIIASFVKDVRAYLEES